MNWQRRLALLGSLAVVASGGSVAEAQCDIQGPQLTAFSFSPSSVNVTSAAATVDCQMGFIDTPAGVAEAECSFRSPSFLRSLSCTATAPSSGDRNAGTFSCGVSVPRYAELGTWRASVSATDAVGNSTVVSEFELEIGGFPADLMVTSVPDLSPPGVSGFDFNPKAVNVASSAANVDCSMSMVDTPAGVASVTCFFDAPVDEHTRGCSATSPSVGTRQNGTFACTATLPRYTGGGSWTASVFATDQVGNLVFLDGPSLQGAGFPTQLSVTSGPEDLMAPSLTGFDFTPQTAETETATVPITCTFDVADALAGVEIASCTFESPGQQQVQDCFALAPVSGTRNSGTFQCDLMLPQYSVGGPWSVSVDLIDRVGNIALLEELDLDALGFPSQLDVVCGDGNGEIGPVIRFSSKTRLIWDAIPDAFFYNVYRGDVAGLAGGSYGTCSEDLNPTDTQFDDSEMPASAFAGFQYLVSYWTLSGGEQGLGNDSSGTPRVVDVPCP